MDEIFDPALEDLAKRYAGQVPYVASDIGRVAALWGNEVTRPRAEALLKQWIDTGEPLRKGVATAWLARAKGLLKPLMRSGGKAAAKQSAPAAASASSIPNHGLPSGPRFLDEHPIAPQPDLPRGPHLMPAESNAPGRVETGWNPGRVHGRIEQEPGNAPRLKQDSHRHAFDAGRQSGHREAAEAHSKLARTTAKYAFGAGAIAGGAGGVAAGHALSQKQRDERKTAAQARWSGHTRNQA